LRPFAIFAVEIFLIAEQHWRGKLPPDVKRHALGGSATPDRAGQVSNRSVPRLVKCWLAWYHLCVGFASSIESKELLVPANSELLIGWSSFRLKARRPFSPVIH
jgi:hypothetical protein